MLYMVSYSQARTSQKQYNLNIKKNKKCVFFRNHSDFRASVANQPVKELNWNAILW